MSGAPFYPFLVHGDCLEFIDTLADYSMDVVITDPPYDMSSEFKVRLLKGLRRICRGNIIAFCKPENQYWLADEYLFWVKTPSTKNFTRACGRFVEMILVRRVGDTFNKLHWSQMIGVYDDRLINPPIHPYEKPASLIERLVRIYTNPGDIVFDPFMGVGTNGLASISLGRKFIGCELDEAYYNTARDRILSTIDCEGNYAHPIIPNPSPAAGRGQE